MDHMLTILCLCGGLCYKWICPFWGDQGPKCVTLLESRIRNLGRKMGSASDEKTDLVTILGWSKLDKTEEGCLEQVLNNKIRFRNHLMMFVM